MATFVPDELIYALDLTKKNLRQFSAVLLLVDMSASNNLWEKFSCAENNGSHGFSSILNFYLGLIVESVYSSEGDIIKLSSEEVVAMWKVRKDEFITKTIDVAIRRALHLKNVMDDFGIGFKSLVKVKMAISSGLVIFSVIGNENGRDFVFVGNPVVEIRKAKDTCARGDVIVTESAWAHASTQNYEYVFRDACNVKIIRLLKDPPKLYAPPWTNPSLASLKFPSVLRQPVMPNANISIEGLSAENGNRNIHKQNQAEEPDLGRKIFTGRFSMTEATRRNLGSHLKTFTIGPVLQQIEKDLPLDNLTETRRISVVIVYIEPTHDSIYELLSLIDECYILFYSIISKHFGCSNANGIRGKAIEFIAVFGLGHGIEEACKNSIICIAKSVGALKCIPSVRGVSVGISTGMAYCGVIGNSVRMNYLAFGSPVEKAIKIANISNGKIYCEFDTIFYSCLPRKKFRSRGVKELKGFGRCHLYEFMDETLIDEGRGNFANLNYAYPILGRSRDFDVFTDILDDICAPDRTYSGFLVEGPGRIGLSRFLDEVVRIAKSRQISVCKLCLDDSSSSKLYDAIHHVLMRLLEAKDDKTLDGRQRALTRKLFGVIPSNDFCYMNIVARVSFPLSTNYVSETDEERLAKTLSMFDSISLSARRPTCVILDDANFIDSTSWQFISRLMDNNKFILVMSKHTSASFSHFRKSDISMKNDARIFRHKIQGLEPENLSALVCQMLNVHAVSKKFVDFLKSRSRNHPGWCEALLTLMLQNESLRVLSLKPEKAVQEDLSQPHPSLITKIPKDLSPEDTTLEFLGCRGKKKVRACLISQEFPGGVESVRDIADIYRAIYDQSTPYEQNILQCAALIGKVFTRNALENILPNHKTLDTVRAIARMIDLRIFECASIQRPDVRTDDSPLCLYKQRITFSDMHHIVHCTCSHSDIATKRNTNRHSRCKLLEFKCNDFREFIETKIAPIQRRDYTWKIIEILERNARKCTACGGGPFIRIPGREKSIAVENSRISRRSRDRIDRSPVRVERKKRSSFPSVSNDESKVQPTEPTVRRISIMPTELDTDEESTSSLGVGRMVACIETISGVTGDKESAQFRNRFLTSYLTADNDPSRLSHLRNFNHIDYRNCQCSVIVDCLMWKLSQYFDKIGNVEKLVKFMIDYSAGLIGTGQSFQASKLLTVTSKMIESSSAHRQYAERETEERRANGSALLALMGDASTNLGDNGNAKNYYIEALRLCLDPSYSSDKFCIRYQIFDQAWKQRFHQRYPQLFVNRLTGYDVVSKIKAAVYLSRLSSILLRIGQNSAAKLSALESFNSGFACSGSFLEKCDIYVKIVDIFRHLGELAFARSLEKPMMYTMRKKYSWVDAEEMAMVAALFKSMFDIRVLLTLWERPSSKFIAQKLASLSRFSLKDPSYSSTHKTLNDEPRLLRGEYEDALILGVKVLKISTVLKMSRTKLSILPQLIQLTIRTKRIHETVDLMKELYYSAPEDIDQSSITWYYALSLDLALDAGMILESFEKCVQYARGIIGSLPSGCVFRDPDSLKRLLTCLWLWQLRMSVPPTFAQSLDVYSTNIEADNFCQVLTASKALECYLLTLTRSINMKRADRLSSLLNDIECIVGLLNQISKSSLFIKPRLNMLKGYMELIRGRKLTAMRYLWKASRLAMDQTNPMMLAWIHQNKRTWSLNQYNNMANYWIEHVGSNDSCDWQNMHCFNVKTWSSTLFPIPVPDTYL